MLIKELLNKTFSLKKEGLSENEIQSRFTDDEWLHINDYLQRRYDIEMFVDKVIAYLSKDSFFSPSNEQAKETFLSDFAKSMKKRLMKGNIKPVYDELMDRSHGFLNADGCFNADDTEMLDIVYSLVKFDISVASDHPSLDMIEFSFKSSTDMESSVFVSVYEASLQKEGLNKGYIEGIFQLVTNKEEKMGTFLFHVHGDFKNCENQNKLVNTYVVSSLDNKDKSFMALLLAENIKKFSLEHDYIKVVKELPKDKEPYQLSVRTEKNQPLLSGLSFESIDKVCDFVNNASFETLPISDSLRREITDLYGGSLSANLISLRFTFMHEKSGIENADKESFLLYVSNRFGFVVNIQKEPTKVAEMESIKEQNDNTDNKSKRAQKQIAQQKEVKNVRSVR